MQPAAKARKLIRLFKILSSEINFCYARIHIYELCSHSLDWVFCARNVHLCNRLQATTKPKSQTLGF